MQNNFCFSWNTAGYVTPQFCHHFTGSVTVKHSSLRSGQQNQELAWNFFIYDLLLDLKISEKLF